MTAQLSRERIEEIANFESDLANKSFIYEDARRMARMLLAGMDIETSFGEHMTLIDKGRLMMLEDSHQTLLDYRADNVWHWQGDEDDQPESLGCPVIMSAETLRNLLAKSAPPAPVAVPDALEQFALFMAEEAIKSGEDNSGWRGKASNAAHEYAQACRADMLKAEPVTSTTVPDGYKYE